MASPLRGHDVAPVVLTRTQAQVSGYANVTAQLALTVAELEGLLLLDEELRADPPRLVGIVEKRRCQKRSEEVVPVLLHFEPLDFFHLLAHFARPIFDFHLEVVRIILQLGVRLLDGGDHGVERAGQKPDLVFDLDGHAHLEVPFVHTTNS